jgi:LysR family glycine cleavage system transcriptional activator
MFLVSKLVEPALLSSISPASHELKSGALVKAHGLSLSLPGYGFYLVYVPNHPQQSNIEAFSGWMRSIM